MRWLDVARWRAEAAARVGRPRDSTSRLSGFEGDMLSVQAKARIRADGEPSCASLLKHTDCPSSWNAVLMPAVSLREPLGFDGDGICQRICRGVTIPGERQSTPGLPSARAWPWCTVRPAQRVNSPAWNQADRVTPRHQLQTGSLLFQVLRSCFSVQYPFSSDVYAELSRNTARHFWRAFLSQRSPPATAE